MEYVEYVTERERMLNSLGRTDRKCEGVWCNRCPFNRELSICIEDKAEYAEECEAIVEKWSKEHPLMTNRDKYNQILKDTFGCTKEPVICPIINITDEYCDKTVCEYCRKWWDEEYKYQEVKNEQRDKV